MSYLHFTGNRATPLESDASLKLPRQHRVGAEACRAREKGWLACNYADWVGKDKYDERIDAQHCSEVSA